MTPAAELLLQCARRRPDPHAICALAKGGMNWTAFLSAANRHDLKSLAFWRLQQCCPDAIPSETFGELRRHFRRNTDRNLYMTGELFRIVEALDRGGVPVAAFKGPVFAWSIYETPGVREYLDLDVLIHPGDVSHAKNLLRELGYRPEIPLQPEAEAQFFKNGGQLVLIRDNPSAIVDLHWDLAPRSMGLCLGAETLWPRLIPVTTAGRPVLSFDPNDQLMLSSLHGGKHGWTTLAWLADIDAIIETRQVDWDRVLATAHNNRLSRALYLGLRLAHDLLKTPIPGEVMSKIWADSTSAALAREAKSYLINGPGDTSIIPRKVVYQWRLTEGWVRQSQLLWRNVTKPNIADSESLKIRPSFFWLYYGARPCRLAVKYVSLLAARLWTATSRVFTA
jgi:hypothetical protein